MVGCPLSSSSCVSTNASFVIVDVVPSACSMSKRTPNM